MTTEAGAPITGAGIKIGIMSSSFNATIDGVIDPADTAAEEGYLPQNASGGSAVTVLQDSSVSGVDNEGLAMAELIHQVAPGAQLYFYTAEGGQDSFAAGVNALVSAGCNIIVDDWSFSDEPFYQIAGPVDTAISNAIANGVSYFSSAGNQGTAYFESTWQPVTTQLVLQSGQPAQTTARRGPYTAVRRRLGGSLERHGSKSERSEEGIRQSKGERGAVAEPPRALGTAGGLSRQVLADATASQPRKASASPLPLLPGDGTQPSSGPLIKRQQHRRSFAEAEVYHSTVRNLLARNS
jgi:hypothetical protein